MNDYERGISDAKKSIAAKVRDLGCYFDKFECYSGRYGPVSGTETLNPDDLAKLIIELDIEP